MSDSNTSREGIGERYPAALYAAVHQGNPGDESFYVESCAGADPVLELGCGTGRIGGRLVREGHEVYGVDHCKSALALAAKAGVIPVAADLRDFSIHRRFKRIIIPYNGLYCLPGDADVVKCLQNARRHLAPQGWIIFDAYAGDALAAPDGLPYDTGPTEQLPIEPISFEGGCWDVFERSDWNPKAQTVAAVYTHVERSTGRTIEASIHHRYLSSYQLPALLEQAGLMLLSLHGDFEEQAFSPASEHMVVRAGR